MIGGWVDVGTTQNPFWTEFRGQLPSQAGEQEMFQLLQSDLAAWHRLSNACICSAAPTMHFRNLLGQSPSKVKQIFAVGLSNHASRSEYPEQLSAIIDARGIYTGPGIPRP